MLIYVYQKSNELYHHGIKGQKWGVRKYQNEDGSLTDAGRKRYGKYDKYKALQDPETGKLTTAGKMVEHDRVERDRKIADVGLGVIGTAHGAMMLGPIAALGVSALGAPGLAAAAYAGGALVQGLAYGKVADVLNKNDRDKAHQAIENGESWYRQNNNVQIRNR